MTPRSPASWDELHAVAAELGVSDLVRDLDATRERLEQGLFHVAFVGQFKRGKSMLMNALLGEAVLPVGVTPVTTAVVVLRHGERRARVELRSGEWQEVDVGAIAKFVAEEENPSNRLGVRRVEVSLPSELLSGGLCLVDTPGVGSVFEANAEETRAFVPQVDVAVGVIGADPPISGEELALLSAITKRTDRLILVLNKCDRLTDDDVRQAVAFTERIVRERLPVPAGPIHRVSAKEVIDTGRPTRDWAELRRALEGLAKRSGAGLVGEASRRARARFASALVAEIDERAGALGRSSEEGERRVALLKTYVSEAERSLHDLGYLLKAEEDRFDRRLEEERARFVAEERPKVIAQLADALRGASGLRGPKLRRRAFEHAQRIVRDSVHAWNEQLGPIAQQLALEITDRFLEHAQSFVEKVRASGVPVDRALALETERGLVARPRYHFEELMHLVTPSPLEWLLETLGPVRGRIVRGAFELLDHLLETNSSRAANDHKDRLFETRRRLESDLRAHLRAVVDRTERAHAEARALRSRTESEVSSAVERLRELRHRSAVSIQG